MMHDSIVDMHIHTINSDGEYSLKQIVEKIKGKDIQTFSITDHDNIDSCLEIKNLELGDMEYYRGVEISSICHHYGVHILGYDFYSTDELVNLLTTIREARKLRFMEMVEMLYKKYGILIADNQVNKVIENYSLIGKPHVTNLLYQLGYGENSQAIYCQYLKGYKSKIQYRVELKEVIQTIKNARGLVVLAHPKEIEKEYHIDIKDIIEDLVIEGVDGIEVYHSIHSLEDTKRYLELAKEYELLVSGGSDYHGPFTKPNVELGDTSIGRIRIKELSLIDELRRRK